MNVCEKGKVMKDDVCGGMYARRNENAAIRHMNNDKILMANGWSEDQAEIISNLARVRHHLHKNPPIEEGGNDYSNELEDIMGDMIELNIPIKFNYNPLDIDSIAFIYEMGESPTEDDRERIREQWSELNTSIEEYLGKIDKKYRTSYRPKGAFRVY